MSAKDKSSLSMLYTEHSSSLIRSLSRKVNTREEAEDIAQNAFMRIEGVIDSGRLDNIKAYLFQTATNLAIDQLRRDRLHKNYIQQEQSRQNLADEIGSSAVDEESPESVLEAHRQLDEIKKSLNNLPKNCRKAFLLHRYRGLSYSQIAEEMSVSVSSVEKYILQALKVFRKALSRAGSEHQF